MALRFRFGGCQASVLVSIEIDGVAVGWSAKKNRPVKGDGYWAGANQQGVPTMKTFLLSLSATAFAIAATALASSPSRAQVEYPWCAISSTGQSGTPNCYYATLDQCKAFLSGQAGFCQANPRATAQAQAPRRSAR
jgi:Protein of unknown function (DUF3551)